MTSFMNKLSMISNDVTLSFKCLFWRRYRENVKLWWNIDIITCARPLCEMSSKLSHKVDKSILNKFWQLAECNQTKIIQASKGLIEDLSLRQVDEVRYIHVQLMVKFWNYSVFWDTGWAPTPVWWFDSLVVKYLNVIYLF